MSRNIIFVLLCVALILKILYFLGMFQERNVEKLLLVLPYALVRLKAVVPKELSTTCAKVCQVLLLILV
jgi:hypothetical protein